MKQHLHLAAALSICGLGVLSTGADIQAAAGEARRDARAIKDVVYDYAVTSYCGVLTRAVQAGFEAELAQITSASGLSAEQAKAQRIAGWVAADREWSNRGLGGFRAWCREEGLGAARHFEGIAGGAPANR